jgi:hypothetical protein
MEFKFTLFNSITLLVMAVTAWMTFARFRFRLDSNWLPLYYLLILGFWAGFDGSLNTWWVVAGVAAAVLLRSRKIRAPLLNGVRGLELGFFGYVLWRGVGLLLLW